jgi:hypothetical protein
MEVALARGEPQVDVTLYLTTLLRYFSGIHVSCDAPCHLPIAHCLSKHFTREEENCPIIIYVTRE